MQTNTTVTANRSTNRSTSNVETLQRRPTSQVKNAPKVCLDKPDELELVEINETAECTSVLYDLLDDPTPSREVATVETNVKGPAFSVTPSRVVITDENVTDRGPVVLEVAEMLLQLHDTENIDIANDNEQLLPVDALKQIDVVKEMAAEDNTVTNSLPDLLSVYNAPEITEDDEDEDDDTTIIYDPPVTPTRGNTSISSPRHGQVTFRHYGIRRRSPKQSNIWKHRCLVCGKSRNSKKELNDHHRKEHSGVICPTCHKMFPTTDSCQRHRYIHRNPVQYKCDVCGKVLPFESDLQRHLKTHIEEKKWECPHPSCDRNFKWKADLDLHTVVHSSVKHKCTWPGCKYSNLDPRNVKRHQKSHTQKRPQ